MRELLKQHTYLQALLLSSLFFAVYHVNLFYTIVTLSPQSLLPQLGGPLLFGLAVGHIYNSFATLIPVQGAEVVVQLLNVFLM